MSLGALKVGMDVRQAGEGGVAEMPGRQGDWGQRNGQLSCQSSRVTALKETKHRNNSYTGIHNMNSRNGPQSTELIGCSKY